MESTRNILEEHRKKLIAEGKMRPDESLSDYFLGRILDQNGGKWPEPKEGSRLGFCAVDWNVPEELNP